MNPNEVPRKSDGPQTSDGPTTNDVLLRWSQMSLDQIEAEISKGKDADVAAQLLGADTLAEAQAISFDPIEPGPREAVVLLPGMMGSLLSSIRGVTTLVWINPLVFLNGNARYLQLSPDGLQDGCAEIEMMPVGVEKLTYTKIGLSLNREFDLFEFPYDWRRPTDYNARLLHASLERWAAGTKRKFTLVGHSLGGLLARTYLALFPREAKRRVKKLLMLGAPHAGAVTAIQTLFTGNDIMQKVDGLNKANNIAAVVRSLPGLYNLLPPPEELFPSGKPYASNWNLYEAAKWFIPGIRQEYLDNTRALYQTLAGADPQIPQVQIAGCNMETMVSVTGDFSGAAGLVRAALQQLPPLTSSFEKAGETSGDGTVPLWSSRLRGADIFYIQEKHVQIANNRQVIEAVKALIHGERCPLPSDLPEPRSFMGISFDVPGEEPAVVEDTPRAFADRLSEGTATREDYLNLHFAL